MSRSRFSLEALPLFGGEPDIWNRLEQSVQEQILDALALLLLRHLKRSTTHQGAPRNHPSFAQGDPG